MESSHPAGLSLSLCLQVRRLRLLSLKTILMSLRPGFSATAPSQTFKTQSTFQLRCRASESSQPTLSDLCRVHSCFLPIVYDPRDTHRSGASRTRREAVPSLWPGPCHGTPVQRVEWPPGEVCAPTEQPCDADSLPRCHGWGGDDCCRPSWMPGSHGEPLPRTLCAVQLGSAKAWRSLSFL